MTRLSAVVLLASLTLLAAAAKGTSAPPPFVYDRELGELARRSLRQAVTEGARPPLSAVLRIRVRCYLDRRSFERTFERRFGAPAGLVLAYYAKGADVNLRGGTCAGVRAFLAGRHSVVTAGAYSILLHESLHRQGLRDERLANCFANGAVRWGAQWLGFDEERALRARDLAFAFTRRYAARGYHLGQPDCLALTRREDWIDLL